MLQRYAAAVTILKPYYNEGLHAYLFSDIDIIALSTYILDVMRYDNDYVLYKRSEEDFGVNCWFLQGK